MTHLVVARNTDFYWPAVLTIKAAAKTRSVKHRDKNTVARFVEMLYRGKH